MGGGGFLVVWVGEGFLLFGWGGFLVVWDGREDVTWGRDFCCLGGVGFLLFGMGERM